MGHVKQKPFRYILAYFGIFWYNQIYTFFISKQGQASALKVAYIFKVLGAQTCLMVAWQCDQVTYVCEEYRNFQDSKSIFLTSDFKIFPILLLRQLNYWFKSYFAFIQRENSLFFNLQFLLSLSERELSPESCLVICHLRTSCL